MKKYGIDTNVLIRYLVQDDFDQSKKAARFLERNCTEESPGQLSVVVLCEIVWVLKTAYGYSKEDILNVLMMVLSAAEFSIEAPAAVWEAFRQFKGGRADFSDYLIGQLNKSNGCVVTITFDKQAGESPNFKLL
ncbi:MAG: PIN domain-containing protein [bacterium]